MPDLPHYLSSLTRHLIEALMERPEVIEMQCTFVTDYPSPDSTPAEPLPDPRTPWQKAIDELGEVIHQGQLPSQRLKRELQRHVPDFIPDTEPTNDDNLQEAPRTEELQRMYLEHCFRSSLDEPGIG